MKTNVFNIETKGDITYLQVPAFKKAGLLKHGFSTRQGGVSTGYQSSMNLGYATELENPENVKKNYELFSEAIGVKPDHIVMIWQTHEDKVACVTGDNRGEGYNKEVELHGYDGQMTNDKDVVLVTTYADCVPLMFYDPKKQVIATSHGGWRGTVLGIGKKTVVKMCETYGCLPEDILVAIMPSIGPCHFEVSLDVKEKFDKVFNRDIIDKIVLPHKSDQSKCMINLQEAHKASLLQAGILNTNITVTDLCTYCESDILFSHRKTKGKRGSMAVMMSL